MSDIFTLSNGLFGSFARTSDYLKTTAGISLLGTNVPLVFSDANEFTYYYFRYDESSGNLQLYYGYPDTLVAEWSPSGGGTFGNGLIRIYDAPVNLFEVHDRAILLPVTNPTNQNVDILNRSRDNSVLWLWSGTNNQTGKYAGVICGNRDQELSRMALEDDGVMYFDRYGFSGGGFKFRYSNTPATTLSENTLQTFNSGTLSERLEINETRIIASVPQVYTGPVYGAQYIRSDTTSLVTPFALGTGGTNTLIQYTILQGALVGTLTGNTTVVIPYDGLYTINFESDFTNSMDAYSVYSQIYINGGEFIGELNHATSTTNIQTTISYTLFLATNDTVSFNVQPALSDNTFLQDSKFAVTRVA